LIRYADIVLDVNSRRAETASGEIELTAREFDLLVTLLREPGRVFTRDQLLDRVWGRDAAVRTERRRDLRLVFARENSVRRGPRPLIRHDSGESAIRRAMINAIRIHRNGEPDEMQWEAIELPAPAAGEARVRHTAIALNFSDVNVRRGGFYITPPSAFPLILGTKRPAW